MIGIRKRDVTMKRYIIGIFVVLAGAVFFLCRGMTPPAQAQSTVVLQYWTFDEIYKKNMEECVRIYNAGNAPDERDIVLETSVLSMDELDYKLWTTLQAGIGAPDLVDLEYAQFGRYINPKNNYLAPLNTIVDQKKELVVADSYDKYRGAGFYYGIDYYAGCCVAFYNQALLDKAGVDAGQIRTWEDFEAAADALKRACSVPMLAVDYTNDFTYEAMLGMFGGEYEDLDSEANIAVLDELARMVRVDETAVCVPSGDFFSYDFFNFFSSEKAAAVFMPFWYLGFIQEHMPSLEGKLVAMPLPQARAEAGPYLRSGGVATAITVQCQDPIIAKNLLRDTRFNEEGSWRCCAPIPSPSPPGKTWASSRAFRFCATTPRTCCRTACGWPPRLITAKGTSTVRSSFRARPFSAC